MCTSQWHIWNRQYTGGAGIGNFCTSFLCTLYHCSGHGEYRTIQDYPIRGRATYLHVRKRKWLDRSSNEIFSYDWDLSEFDGTRLNSEFVSFLKEGD